MDASALAPQDGRLFEIEGLVTLSSFLERG